MGSGKPGSLSAHLPGGGAEERHGVLHLQGDGHRRHVTLADQGGLGRQGELRRARQRGRKELLPALEAVRSVFLSGGGGETKLHNTPNMVSNVFFFF